MADSKSSDETAYLLKYLLAIELYRSGLSQAEIRRRLSLSMTVLSKMLQGVQRHMEARILDG
jgi:hypothetical protein